MIRIQLCLLLYIWIKLYTWMYITPEKLIRNAGAGSHTRSTKSQFRGWRVVGRLGFSCLTSPKGDVMPSKVCRSLL